MESIKEFPRGILDQVISKRVNTYGVQKRAPGPGLNLLAGSSDPVHGQQPPLESGATSFKHQAPSNKLQSLKLQAASIKPQATSVKLQAASNKLFNFTTLIKFQAASVEARG